MMFNETKIRDAYPVDIYSLPIKDRILLWLIYGERGISSETICRTLSELSSDNIYKILSGKDKPDFLNHRNNLPIYNSPPGDAADFRRCYLLLKLIPEFRDQLYRVAEKYPQWDKYVRNWEKMTVLFESDVDERGWSNRLWDFMKNELK